jgi:hypothetical protein
VKYHGHDLTIIWDQDGKHYGRGRGLMVLADGKEIAQRTGKTDEAETGKRGVQSREKTGFEVTVQ